MPKLNSTQPRQRFTADYDDLRFFIELLVSGWFAGSYNLASKRWLWKRTVSDVDEGKRLILETHGINPEEIVWKKNQRSKQTATKVKTLASVKPSRNGRLKIEMPFEDALRTILRAKPLPKSTKRKS